MKNVSGHQYDKNRRIKQDRNSRQLFRPSCGSIPLGLGPLSTVRKYIDETRNCKGLHTINAANTWEMCIILGLHEYVKANEYQGKALAISMELTTEK